jgi:carbamoyltransferase
MNILGLNSFFENPSAALVVDGELVFAIEDERLTRVKHGRAYTPYAAYLPYDSIYAALKFAGLKASAIDEVAYSYNRYIHLGASVVGCTTGRRLKSLRQEISAFHSIKNVYRELVENHTLTTRYGNLWQRGDLRNAGYREWDHHLTHAASAFFCSGFDRGLVVVADGRGEDSCTSVYLGSGSKLNKIASINLPHSLGFLYSFFTQHLGFQPFEDEYKVMGLAAYGEPEFMPQMTRLVRLEPTGCYTLDAAAVRNLTDVFGPARRPGEELTQHHKNLARSLQTMLENALIHVISYHLKSTGERTLSVAGGVFLNCLANAKLARLPGVEAFFAQPASSDAGTAIGAAALTWIERGGAPQLRYSSMLLGTEWSDQAIERALKESSLPYRSVPRDLLAEQTAALLNDEYVVAFFQGRMEFGPRALGARSFLASPRSPYTRERLNIIKGREQFRPLAPLVLEAEYDTYFDGYPNRYMMLAVQARDAARERAPAIVHADGSSRAQVVRRQDDALLFDILTAFAARSGVPILINTSLNVRGKPIDESPVDALASAVCSGVDAVVIGSFIVDLRAALGTARAA